jgi:MoxR-like ATPase
VARDPRFDHLYPAFSEFLECCIFDTRSITLPDRHAWTPENVAEVKRRLVDEPDFGPGSFIDKLKLQMEGASPDQWVVLADAHYVYYLPPSSLRLSTKIDNVNWCLTQGGLNPPDYEAEFWEPFRKNGFTHVSQRYNLRYLQLWLILLFAHHLKQQGDPRAIVADHRQMQALLDRLLDEILSPSDRAYDMRHALLYLAHPGKYERAISTRDKEKMVETYREKIAGDVPDDLDEAIRQIRVALAPDYDQEDRPFDFYSDLKDEWRLGPVAKPPPPEPPAKPPAMAKSVRNMLRRTRNVILYGPPGTGKTYVGQKVADLLAAEQGEGQSKKGSFVEQVTFHQSYAYEDFVEGWRPVEGDNEGEMAYRVEPGVLRQLAHRAEGDPENSYVLFIDEINRGNIAKVFGELITLLEDDKRQGQPNEMAMTLPYSKEVFALPSNIYVIGTMNTADRSIALLDVALRRRFAFVEIMPEPALLRGSEVASETHRVDLGQLLASLNRRIVQSLDRDHQIGHSYLLQVAQQEEAERMDALEYVWNAQILPLLEEYFYSQREVLVDLLRDFVDTGDAVDEAGSGQEFGRLSGEDLVFALSQLAER